MSGINRLPVDAPHGFGGQAIDRSRPMRFRLDGRIVEAFSGDTVLTALLASDIRAGGSLGGQPLALDEQTPYLVLPRGGSSMPLPVARLPAIDGLDLVSVETRPTSAAARPGLFGRLLGVLGRRAPPTTTEDGPGAPPWLAAEPVETLEVDTLIVGGGVAGLAAAGAAKGRTVLVERRTWLGGDVRYFGTTGDELPPDSRIAALTADLKAEIMLSTEVFDLVGRRALAHQVMVDNGRPISRVVEIVAQAVVLATGCFERLPLFSGNRLPGVGGTIAAFHLADRHGVWLGRRAVFSTSGAHGYRLALLAHDAGITVQRIADTRLNPHSRFIDFCKASGVSYATSLVPGSASLRGTTLSVGFAVAIEGIRQDTSQIETELFVAGGGLQPELGLWLQAGGATVWEDGRLLPSGTLPGISVAGSADGYIRTRACVESGLAAMAGKARQIDDAIIDAAFESPDGPTPIAPLAGSDPTWLDRGTSLARRPAANEPLSHPLPLSLGDLSAAVQLGAIPPTLAGAVATERCVLPKAISDIGWRVPSQPATAALPAFLNGRFGPKPQLCVVRSADARFFERGALVFARADQTDPGLAIGAITGPAPDGGVGGLALIEREASKGAAPLYVRDAGMVVPLERIVPQKA